MVDKQWYENKCYLCGKEQTPFGETDKWKQYKCREKCSCGGEFMLFIDGDRIGDPSED